MICSSGPLLQLSLEGKIEEKRGQGRPRRKWMDDVKEWSGLTSSGDTKRKAENREEWRDMFANLRNLHCRFSVFVSSKPNGTFLHQHHFPSDVHRATHFLLLLLASKAPSSRHQGFLHIALRAHARILGV
ncbi:eukaryotic translation initiation factor 3 subunit F [Elysia marginata]|uniref:Eukaryotic translation initiation factor 3 subunit F n=1 Tax=Elysia marginata TaxID=1093978 RepID=A0AAV4IEP8_9GAST|nr:eukaryotic translation initiation factor 3 subunit F [Elysia marginata]